MTITDIYFPELTKTSSIGKILGTIKRRHAELLENCSYDDEMEALSTEALLKLFVIAAFEGNFTGMWTMRVPADAGRSFHCTPIQLMLAERGLPSAVIDEARHRGHALAWQIIAHSPKSAADWESADPFNYGKYEKAAA